MSYGPFISSITNGTAQLSNSKIVSAFAYCAFIGSVTNGTASIENSNGTDLTMPINYLDGGGFMNGVINATISIINSNIIGFRNNTKYSVTGGGLIGQTNNSAIKIHRATITGINFTNAKFNMITLVSTNSTFDIQQSYSYGTNLDNQKTVALCINYSHMK
ncbi:Hypothetical_protein [Hexamita inflata]|uniref:Hypothetical_protein n=1 Tax=Hexamita inflata TaxID=28002 RepID=A0AA86VTP2_9EUKA|nr:Hypothetical protein HINF_LOCUS65253 [Hexamita inflata]